MRRFKLVSDMNIRKSINGDIAGLMKAGEIVEGTQFETASNGTVWLNNTNKVKGWVAVLPESKGYAREITDSDGSGSGTTDYKALYDAEVKRNRELEGQIKALKDSLIRLIVLVRFKQV